MEVRFYRSTGRAFKVSPEIDGRRQVEVSADTVFDPGILTVDAFLVTLVTRLTDDFGVTEEPAQSSTS